MASLCSLPRIPMVKIMEYLPVADVLNLRLTCSYMFVSSQFNEFFKRVKLQINLLSTEGLKVFKNLCNKFVSIFTLQINSFDGDINLLLPYIKNIKKVIIHTKQLEQISSECMNIINLTIDIYSLSSEKSVQEEVNFACLSKLAKLDELSLGVRNNYMQQDVLNTSDLHIILTSAKSISKIKFIGDMNITGPKWIQYLDEKEQAHEKQVAESLAEVISSSHNIKEWSFSKVYWQGNLFQFPNNINILTWKVPVLLNPVCLLDTNVEQLRIDFCAFDAKNFKIPSLKMLEIYGDKYDHDKYGGGEDLVDPIDVEGLYLPELEDLCVCCVSDLFQFEPLLLPTLKRLSLGPKKTLKESHFAWISRMLRKCVAICTLVIDQQFYKSDNQLLAISESGLKNLLETSPSLEIRFVGKFQNITISLKNFDKQIEKIRHLL